MAYFEPDFLRFFKELAANNHKDWFDENRQRYHKIVKEPFRAFVTDLIAEIQKEDSRVDIGPSDAIFRINRDIRFSKDKTPYKLHVSAIVSRYGKKDKSYPGLYVHLSPEHTRFYGGLFRLTPDQTNDMRYAIAENSGKFNKLLKSSDFKKTFGEVHGEQAKRIPKELKGAAEKEPLIFNKNMYFFNEQPAEFVLSDDLIEKTMERYHAAKPIHRFFEKALFE